MSEPREPEIDLCMLARVVEETRDLVAISDLDLRLEYVNEAGRRLLGFGTEEEVRSTEVRECLYCEDAAYAVDTVIPSVRKGHAWSGKLRLRHLRTGVPIAVYVSEMFLITNPETGKPAHLAAVGRELSEAEHLEATLQGSFEEVRRLADRLENIREEERRNVAREIHDELGQALTAIKLDFVSILGELPESDQIARRSKSILELISDMIHTVRRISTELRTGVLDEADLITAMEWTAQQFSERTGLAVDVNLPQVDIDIAPNAARALFRTFQEALTNVARHAQATHVWINLAFEDKALVLSVRDNGKGFSKETLSAESSLGIVGMKERAVLSNGDLSIDSMPGKGTTVTMRVPTGSGPKDAY